MSLPSKTQACAALLALLTACGDGAGGSLAQSEGTSAALCAFDPLFEPRTLGDDGSDSVRHIAFDDAHDQVLFSGYVALFQVGKQGGEPHKLGDLLGTLESEFWLSGEQILVPGGIAMPFAEDASPVLLAMPRTGGPLGPLVTLDAPRSTGRRRPARHRVRGPA